jgi:hypothetical protein
MIIAGVGRWREGVGLHRLITLVEELTGLHDGPERRVEVLSALRSPVQPVAVIVV